MNELTGSPFQVQIVGAAFFAPMFFTGALGGVISDRLDRRRTLLAVSVLVIPATGLMAALNLSGAIVVWMVYPYMLVIGVSHMVDMTSRRALVYDIVGASRLTNALALEALAMMSGALFGGIAGGSMISLLGIGQGFLLVGALYVVAFALLVGVAAPGVKQREGPAANILQDLRATLASVPRNATLVSILGVTILMNAFYFPFTPMVPVFADQLDVNAFWTGLLAGAPAIGSIAATLMIARGLPITRGHGYVGGSVLAMIFLGVFAAADWYLLALAALVIAGLGHAGFATMQSALVMTTATDEMRGRALGVMSMCIGILPFSMLSLGAAAEALGPSAGVISGAVIGLVLMAIWGRWRPEAQRQA